MWFSVSCFVVAPLLFMLLYPRWVAKRSGASPLLQWPGYYSLLREAMIGAGLAIMLMMTLAAFELIMFGKLLELPEPIRQLVSANNLVMPLIMAGLAVTIVPFAEELFFRGLIYGSVRQCSVAGALIVQAVLFAALHFYDLTYSMFVFLGGIAFGTVYQWRRSLWTPIFMHLTCIAISLPLLVSTYLDNANRPVLGRCHTSPRRRLPNHEDRSAKQRRGCRSEGRRRDSPRRQSADGESRRTGCDDSSI